jgi:hypothetical protein
MADELRERAGARAHLKWIKASAGNTVRLIPIEQVLYLRADAMYTAVAWEGGVEQRAHHRRAGREVQRAAEDGLRVVLLDRDEAAVAWVETEAFARGSRLRSARGAR